MKNALLLIVLISFPKFTTAQSFELVSDHSTIQVKDIDKSAAFYADILQLKEIATPWPENPTIRFFDMGADQQLHIAEVDQFGPVKVNKVLHLAFATQDLEGYTKFLDTKGIAYFNFNEESKVVQLRPDGVHQIYFKDPDGYWIEINDAVH